MDGFGEYHPCRLLCDPGSQVSLMTSRLFTTLALPKQRGTIHIEGIGSIANINTRGRAVTYITSLTVPTFTLQIEFHIIDSITSSSPTVNLPEQKWPHLRDLSLADPKFGNIGRVDALLGADVWG